jgi:hypothetical protein
MAGLVVAGQTGVQAFQDGVNAPPRMMRSGELAVSEVHGRFYEQAYRGNLFSIGLNVTALSANTITLTSSTTPIYAVWNPPVSSINVVPLQAMLQCFPNSLTSGAGPGAFVWASSIGNSALSATVAPFNRKSLNNVGSQARALTAANALTGLTNNLVVFDGADFSSPTGLTYTTLGSTQTLVTYGGIQNFDGSLIVPPGGILALLNTTSSTVFSVAGRLMWEEVPL